MTRKRTIATMAALGGFTAAVALLSGLPAAKADELADLRANQELLQRRVEQLAQLPAAGSPVGGLYPGGPPGPVGVQTVGGSFPRSFLIPGTDTSIRVGGEIRAVAVYFFNGGNPTTGNVFSTTIGNNGQAQAIAVTGVARNRDKSIFGISPRESKVTFETRTPTAWGEARSFMEFDWAGSTNFAPGGANPTSVSDNLHPRLRHAYATLGGLLAGQANSNFADPDASPEALDFGGTFGDPGVVRIPQVRYTMPLAGWGIPGALSFSAETPETDIWTAAGIIANDASSADPAGSFAGGTVNPTKTPAPDLTMAWYIPQPWGHVDFSAVLRPALQVKDGLFVDRTFTGYGGHFGGDVRPGWFGWARDDITFQFVYGDAIGRYLNSSSSFALVASYPALAAPPNAAAAANVLIKPVVAWGGNLGYQHHWTPNLRSTLSGGVRHADIDSLVVARVNPGARNALNKELVNTHVNLIWSPVAFADIGLEYTWAHRLVVSNRKGDMNALISRFRMRF